MAAALLVAAPAVAQERSIWALVLNDEPKSDVEIVLTPDGPWVDPSALVAAGVVKVPDGRRRVFAPDTIPLVLLPSLAPQITFTLDEAEIRLIVAADPALLRPTELAISNPRPPGWKVSSNNAIFLNYSANWSTDNKSTGYGELGVHLFGALFQSAASVDEHGAVTPGLTSLTFDQVRRRRRWVLGDTIGRSTTLGSSPVVGGFGVSTQQDLDPYYAIYPSPQVRGAVRTPSTADLYVDGRLVSSVRLPPGRFTLNDLPIETGLGNARVIIRDAFGRQQSIDLGFYLSTQLLKQGEQDYSYVAGLERTSSGTKVEYGRAMGTAVHNVGLTDSLTIGFQAEGAKDLGMAGAGFNARLWRLGTFGAEGLASVNADQEQGYAATGVYAFLSKWVSTQLRGTWIGPEVPESLSRAGRPGAGERRRVGELLARQGWFAHCRRDAWRPVGDQRAHLATRCGFPRTPPRLGEDKPAGCPRGPTRQVVATGLHAERHVTRTAVGERDARGKGGIASRMGGLCRADLCARLAHGGQRGDDGRRGR